MYKVVDNFNGGEHGFFKTKESADIALKRMIDEFHTFPGNTGLTCRLTVVPGGHSWYCNPRIGQWVWG